MTARSFREFVTTALLLHQPHNYSERLRRLKRPATPRDVKRAVDYIEANLDAAIGLPEIVAASGGLGRKWRSPASAIHLPIPICSLDVGQTL